MKKRYCIITQTLLLLWLFLDMTGVYFSNSYLVTRSYKDDGLFFLIYLVAMILFSFKENNREMGCLGMDIIMVRNSIFMPRMVHYF